MAERLTFPLHRDARGGLVPIELDAVPFAVRRVFVVTGPPGGATRGEHTTRCAELLCLVSGTATMSVGSDPDDVGDPVTLETPGDAMLVAAGTYLAYTLADEHSSIVVLAEQPYSWESAHGDPAR